VQEEDQAHVADPCMVTVNCTNGWTHINFLQESMKANKVLWTAPSVSRIVTGYRILGEDFVTSPYGAFFS